MELSKHFEPELMESRWYAFWEQSGYFQAKVEGGAPPYCIQLPPPNVTGSLHMGHAFQHTLMDLLIRYHRMLGDRTLWQPGTDHAGIATQILVERKLEAEGETRLDVGRERFIEKVWAWKAYSGGTITQQMRRLGASCDWGRERFTLDPALSEAVTEVFVALNEQGLIYRGKRLVNWDPLLQTAVSDLEVRSEEESGLLWQIAYTVEDASGQVVVATTRPETLFGDAAVAVHPEDPRYQAMVGKRVHLPLSNRLIPIIADPYVDPDFGTGCVKITPAHDFNDYQVWLRHRETLEATVPCGGLIRILDLSACLRQPEATSGVEKSLSRVTDATAWQLIPKAFQGVDRFVARAQLVRALEASGHLLSTQPHRLMVPRCERSGAVVEPMLTDQWFVAMTALPRSPSFNQGKSLADVALEVVKNGEVSFVPKNWESTYRQWLENIQDWCISRQLWWGHRIPAWYDAEGRVFVARTVQEAAAKAQLPVSALRQDEDVLDTWFSSALWCFSTLGWPAPTPELKLFLPSTVLVTGFDILFFWVARMVMLTLPFTKKVPFQQVYVTGLVRDAHGHKMSKSKGNVVDPIDLIDGIDRETLVHKRTHHLMNPREAKRIEDATRRDYPEGFPAFGVDALRFTFASIATHARDIRFDVKRIEGYRNFCNKLWNASRFIVMQAQQRPAKPGPQVQSVMDRWIESRMQQLMVEVKLQLDSYRFDLAAHALYDFIWNEYCDWYVELSKVQLQRSLEEQRATVGVLASVLERLLRLLHPIMPFITEELWQTIVLLLRGIDEQAAYGPSIMVAPWPIGNLAQVDHRAIDAVQHFQQVVSACRTLRAEMRLSPAERVPLWLESADGWKTFLPYLPALAKVSTVQQVDQLPDREAPIAVVGSVRLMLAVDISPSVEKARLSKEMAKIEQEIARATIQLENPAFIAKAPADVIAQIRHRHISFSDQLAALRKRYECF